MLQCEWLREDDRARQRAEVLQAIGAKTGQTARASHVTILRCAALHVDQLGTSAGLARASAVTPSCKCKLRVRNLAAMIACADRRVGRRQLPLPLARRRSRDRGCERQGACVATRSLASLPSPWQKPCRAAVNPYQPAIYANGPRGRDPCLGLGGVHSHRQFPVVPQASGQPGAIDPGADWMLIRLRQHFEPGAVKLCGCRQVTEEAQ